MAQPSPFTGGEGSIPTADGKDELRKEKARPRTSAYLDPGTQWVMTMRERDEFNPDDYRIKDRLLYSGSIVWKKENRGKGVSLFIYILNTHLILTLKKRRLGAKRHFVFRRPIPLEFLDIVGINSSPAVKGPALKSNEPDTKISFQIRHIGLIDQVWDLYATQDRLEWLNQFSSALEIREMSLESRRVFRLEEVDLKLADPIPGGEPDAGSEHRPRGKINCCMSLKSLNGKSLFAFGGEDGFWVGEPDEPSSFKALPNLIKVTYCANLEEFALVIIVADGVMWAYHIEAVYTTIPYGSHAELRRMVTPMNCKVRCCSVGRLGNRTVLLSMMKSDVGARIVRVAEPILRPVTETQDGALDSSYNLNWLRVYRQWTVWGPSVYSVTAFEDRVLLQTEWGFQHVDVHNLKSVTVSHTAKRFPKPYKYPFGYWGHHIGLKSNKPLGIVRLDEEECLLCFQEFGLYTNVNGKPTRRLNRLGVHWESKALSMAYRRPHLILFSPQLIEVRHVRTGELVQVLRDRNCSDFQFLWDGRGFPPGDGEEPLVHLNVGPNISGIKIMRLVSLATSVIAESHLFPSMA